MSTSEPAPQKRTFLDYRMIWRWHFYAGLVCIPFVLILSITGPIYLFKPQIETMIDRAYDDLSVTGPLQNPAAIVAAAQSAVPGSHLKAIEVRQNPNDAIRVTLSRGSESVRVYVHPQCLRILKQVPDTQRFMAQVANIHGKLLLGSVGDIIVEMAACWAIIMILSGLYMWWPRSGRLEGVLWPRFGAGGRVFWRDIHAVIGFYISTFALFLLLSGLPWTSVWGEGFKQVRKITHTDVAHQDWASGLKKAPVTSDDHASHAEHNTAASMPTDHADLEAMTVNLRQLNLAPPVLLVPAKTAGGDWSGKSDSQNRTVRATVTLNPRTGAVVTRQGFAEKHPVDQVVGVMISAHEGQLFGWVNQLLGLLTGLGLITLCVTSVVMWLKRKPVDSLGAPTLPGHPIVGAGLIALIIGLGLFLPLFGLSLIGVLIIERMILRRIAPVRDWLGLRA